MEATTKRLLRALSLELRHLLEGRYDEDGRWRGGDLEARLNAIGVWRDRPSQPIDEVRHLSEADVRARKIVDAWIQLRHEAGVARVDAVREFMRETAAAWANRLVALRCMEARELIDEVILQKDVYGGRSLEHHRLARRRPEACGGDDEGLFEVLLSSFADQARALPILFDPEAPAVALRPSVVALRRAVALLSGTTPVKAQDCVPPEMFLAADTLGWFYQFWQQDEKTRVDELTRTKKGYKCEGADLIPKTALYTEPYMVRFLVQNSLGATWASMHPDTPLVATWEYFVRDAHRSTMPSRAVAELTFLDPACGSGHFLLEAFDLFWDMYHEAGALDSPAAICESILRHNLFGIDIDERAIQIAGAALWMKAAEKAPDFAGAPMNLVATSFRLPGDGKAHLKAFLADHPEDAPLRPALEVTLEALTSADELGSLLRLQEPVEKELRHQKDAYPIIDGDVDFSDWKDAVLERLRQHFQQEAVSSEPGQAFFGRSAERGLALFDLLSRRYDVVAANPPYMGSKSMGKVLKSYVGTHYAPGKRDLFAAFMLRCLELCRSGGRLAMVTQQTWMFLGSYETLRYANAQVREKQPHGFRGFLAVTSLETVAHMGRYAFSEIGSAVVIPALVTMAATRPQDGHRLWACRLTAPRLADEQAALLRQAARGDARSIVYQPRQRRLLDIPQAPVSYWLSERMLELLTGPTLGDVATVSTGLQTSDDPRFLRFVWECPPSAWAMERTSRRWVAFEKGGGYGKWHGHHLWMVEYEAQGARIRATSNPRVQNSQLYFSEGWTYSYMARGRLGVRQMDGSAIFAHKSPAVIPHETFPGLGALLNARPSSVLARAISASVQLAEGAVERLPVPAVDRPALAAIERACIRLKAFLDGHDPCERSFLPSEATCQSLHALVVASQCTLLGHAALLHALEGKSERLVFDAYDFDPDDRAMMLAEAGTPPAWFPLVEGLDRLPPVLSRYLEAQALLASLPQSLTPVQPDDGVRERLALLYARGPGAAAPAEEAAESPDDDGNDEAVLVGAHLPMPPETFLEELAQVLELHPISAYWLLKDGIETRGWRCPSEEQRIVADRFNTMILRLLGHRWPREVEDGVETPGYADADGIIPLTPGTPETTLLERLRERMADEFPGGNPGAIEREFEEIMGRSLEQWLMTDFWKHHVRQFRKRPIAWQIQSASATGGRRGARGRAPAFAALVYYHRLDEQTLSRIQAQYARPQRQAMETEARGIEAIPEGDRSPGQMRRRELLASSIEELVRFDEALETVIRTGFDCAALHEAAIREQLDTWTSADGFRPAPPSDHELARQEGRYSPDLNDGVRVNIAPLVRAGVLAPSDVLAARDDEKAIADRATWRRDERSWCRGGHLPRPGWWRSEQLDSHHVLATYCDEASD